MLLAATASCIAGKKTTAKGTSMLTSKDPVAGYVQATPAQVRKGVQDSLAATDQSFLHRCTDADLNRQGDLVAGLQGVACHQTIFAQTMSAVCCAAVRMQEKSLLTAADADAACTLLMHLCCLAVPFPYPL